ncbi:MAG: aspartate--tRNA(Asn) ligase [Candidatus Thermoplasmatota archaeon]|jgi:aspartyl-tRNA synthetase|nr:aspartate--tRNA(Asn) ligase [Candidatus Thermoplasmatota archaeon]
MERTYLAKVQGAAVNSEINVCGWIQELRALKNIVFIVLRDNTGTVQVTLKPENISNINEVRELERESVICVTGVIPEKTKSTSNREIVASSLVILNRAEKPLPLGITDPVSADFETRLNNRFLDLRKRENALVFRIESSMLWGMRRFFHSKNFVEIHTPKIVAAATEGGADLFGVRYFEKEAYLNQSPQLYKEIMMSAGLDRVFEVGPAFRAEQHNTVRHLNEFTSVDIEMSFADHHDAMHMLENAIRAGIEGTLEELGPEIASSGIRMEIPEVPFPRISYRECIAFLKTRGVDVTFGEDFSPEQLREIGSQYSGFYFITGWPSSLRAFYTMPSAEDPEISNSFDLQYNEKEITSGAQRVHDPELLTKRFLSKGLNPDDFDFYIRAFRYGMPPHAGFGLGLERLVMILCNLQNIREATLFPRDRTRIVP